MGRRKGSTFKTDAAVFVALNSHYEPFKKVERCKEVLKEIDEKLDRANEWEAPLLIDSRETWVKRKQRDEEHLSELGLHPDGLTFDEIVDGARLSLGAVSDCLKRFCSTGYVLASKGDRKRYKMVNRTGLVEYILSRIGGFQRIKAAFKKTMSLNDKPEWSYRSFWMVVLEEEMIKTMKRIDDLSITPDDLRFIMLYDNYLWSFIPEGGAFEDFFFCRHGVRIYPPMTEVVIYLLLKYPMVERLLMEEKGAIKLSKEEEKFPDFWQKIHILRKHKNKLERMKIETVKDFKENPRVFSESNPCPYCGNSGIICDFDLGEVVCSKCGMVLRKIWWET